MEFIVKSIIVVLVAITLQEIRAIDNDNPFIEVVKKCQEEHNLDDLQIEDFKNITEDSNFSKDLKCFSHCLLKNLELLDDNGKLDIDKLIESSENLTMDLDTITDCKAVHDMIDDPCEYSFEMFKCNFGQE